jgi:hypothetical protein
MSYPSRLPIGSIVAGLNKGEVMLIYRFKVNNAYSGWMEFTGKDAEYLMRCKEFAMSKTNFCVEWMQTDEVNRL